jgi:hypothetical protein
MFQAGKKYFQFHHLFLCVMILAHVSAHAQTFEQTRYEKVIKSSDYDFTVIPLKEKGLALIHNPDKYDGGKKIQEVILIDPNMQETWQTELKLEPVYKFIGYEYLPGMLYLLYRVGDTDYNDLHLISIHIDTHEIANHRIKHQFNLKLSHFFMVGSSVVFGGSINKESSILIFDIVTGRIKIVPGFFLNDSELLDLKANENNTFNALLLEHSNTNSTKLMLRTYDETGGLLLEDVIEVDKDVVIISGLTSTLLREELLIAGFYGYGNTQQAVGLYSVLVDPFSEQKIQYHEFALLNQFADYMGPKRATKTVAKERQRKMDGKRPELKVSTQPIRIQEQPNGFLLLSEVFLPSTSFNSSPLSFYPQTTGFYPYGLNAMGRGYSTPYAGPSNFSQNTEVRILETFVTLFDATGEITFDQSLPVNDVKLSGLDQASDFVTYKDKIILAYRKESDLFMKTGDVGSSTFTSDTLKIELKNESDVVHIEQDGDANLRHWYENNFYVFGKQSIKDKNKDGNTVRYVFFINKLEVR